MLINRFGYWYMYMLICNVFVINLKNNNFEQLEKLMIVFIKFLGMNRFIVKVFLIWI